LRKRMLTAKVMPEIDNDQVKHVAAEPDTRGDARGDVEKGSPGALGPAVIAYPRRETNNEFALRGEVASVDGAWG